MSWYQRIGLETSFLYDLPNFLICILVVFIVSSSVKLPRNYMLLLLAHCFVPFILNDVLFPTSYMPDQFKYIASVIDIRSGNSVTESSSNVANASWMLAFIPLPFVETTQSLGFFNKLIFILMFAFLYKKGGVNRFSAYFLLLYPSIVLYTGLSLRDTLVFCSMMLSAYFAIKRNFLLMTLFIAPLYFIKFQNFFLMLPLFAFALFNLTKKGLSVRKALVILVIVIIVMLMSFPIAAPLINSSRLAMYREDGGVNAEGIPLITNVGDFIYLGITSGLYFFAKPFPWEANSPLQLIQVFENLIIMFIVVKLTVQAWRKSVRDLMFWLVLFLVSLSIYGLVVFNYGTAARYRFPFIALYVVYVAYTCNITHIFNRKKKLNPSC
ncbi:hypothetical protein HC000_11565 [Pseudoalteromonas sp. MIP2626]|uniref:hypothetical protein n=1 Tax=Pseudoalteromonas sp. MIP2626 TaxID=2705464 RepID=UPI0015C7A6F9|nr:hypothetical protein [Pseudoalteromonas sp. MIP2626]NYR13102.1 hypothetical protein [Pseudoalteromonas sp. MIP2626]